MLICKRIGNENASPHGLKCVHPESIAAHTRRNAEAAEAILNALVLARQDASYGFFGK